MIEVPQTMSALYNILILYLASRLVQRAVQMLEKVGHYAWVCVSQTRRRDEEFGV